MKTMLGFQPVLLALAQPRVVMHISAPRLDEPPPETYLDGDETEVIPFERMSDMTFPARPEPTQDDERIVP